jgi:hypothetical protein
VRQMSSKHIVSTSGMQELQNTNNDDPPHVGQSQRMCSYEFKHFSTSAQVSKSHILKATTIFKIRETHVVLFRAKYSFRRE